MSAIENRFGFIGWCTEGTSDKIWGYFYRGDNEARPWRKNVCVFWARRGSAMQFKPSIEDYELEKLVESKKRKGYQQIDQTKLMKIWPSFIQEAEAKLMWEVLAGNVK